MITVGNFNSQGRGDVTEQTISSSTEERDNVLQLLSLVICGHVDSGNSTTTCRLRFELGGILERELHKLKHGVGRLEK